MFALVLQTEIRYYRYSSPSTVNVGDLFEKKVWF
jgi:hypothetical protein